MDLIKIDTDQYGKQTVNARDLHEFLESKQDFSTWVKARVNCYNFVENQDFVTLHKKMGRQILNEYHLSIDMAKELSMVERNEKGKQARQYFIDCERKARGEGLSPAEHLLHQAQMLVKMEREQNRIAEEQRRQAQEHIALEGRQVESETRLARVESLIESDPGYFAITGYANLIGLKIDADDAKRFGKAATKLSKKLGVSISKVRHGRWGLVNAYHESVLAEVMNTKLLKTG